MTSDTSLCSTGMPFNDTYTSSKFAMEGFTECQATYLHRYGIHISLVEPGPILTDFVNRVEKDHKLPEPDDAYSALTPEFEKVSSLRQSSHMSCPHHEAGCPDLNISAIEL